MEPSLIINGDDFGLSPGINRGIIEAHQSGTLTSTSLMANGDAFDDAVALARRHPHLSVGVHLTLVEGAPVLAPQQVPSLVGPDGRFCESLSRFMLRWLTGRIRLGEVQHEFEAQVEKVLDHNIHVDKLDSHMHLHMLPGLFQLVLALAKRYQIRAIRLPRERVVMWHQLPRGTGLLKRGVLASLAFSQARKMATAGVRCADQFCGVAESGRLREADLLQIFRHLRPGVTEVMIHPGYRDATLEGWPRSRHYEREGELRALLSPRVKSYLETRRITLTTYRDVGLKV